MAGTALIAEWVDRLDELAVVTADRTLRETGMLQPPTVHILVEGVEPPYVGYLTCRPFYRGSDARVAVAALGILPSALRACRLVITWEHSDLCTAFELPDPDSFPAGVVVVDADRHRHVLRWHPMRMHPGAVNGDGVRKVVPEWRPGRSVDDAALPEPVAALLAIWRARQDWSDVDLVRACGGLDVAGYEMRWVRRRVDGGHPGWARVLAPLME